MVKLVQSTKNLKQMLNVHFYHEVRMLLVSLLLIKDKDALVQAAGVEIYLLHLRALNDFFFEPGKKDDAVVFDFVKTYLPEGSKIKEKLRINKNLAHLTYSRLSDAALGKYNLEDCNVILKNVSKFLKEIPQNYSSDKI